MDGEEQGREGGRGAGSAGVGGAGGSAGQADEPQGQRVDRQGGQHMEDEIGQVESAGMIEAPDAIVRGQGEPSQGLVVPGVSGGEHPLESFGAETAERDVMDDVVVVVPIEEAGAQHGQKCREGHDGDDQRRDDPQRGQ